MVSGLRVNFFKSSICGVNLKPEFLEATSGFFIFALRDNSIPFKFMGTVVRDSPRKAKSWKLVVKELKNRLVIWRGKNLSVGGRVVLIKSVLNILPIFTLSFYKAPTNH